MMKKIYILIAFSLVIGALSCLRSAKSDQQPNILLIIADDLGYNDFGPHHPTDPRVHTPSMSRLAESGVVFTQAYTTAPVCSPSRSGIHTGQYQFRWDETAGWGPGLPDTTMTIAEYVREAGYETVYIGKSDFGTNYHRFDVREYPLNHGFDEFLGFSAHAHDYWHSSTEMAERTPDPLGTSAHLGPLMHNEGYKSYEEGYLTDILTDEAITWMSAEREQPFFMTLAYNAVHHVIHEVPQQYLDVYEVNGIHNYDPDSLESFGNITPGTYSAYYEKYTRLGVINDENMRKFYLANLHCLDDNIGRLLDALEEHNLNQETMVILVSDNGGSPITGANNFPLSAGKYSIWEGGIRIPMVMSWPGKVQPGSKETLPVSTLDILPTIVHAVGIESIENQIDGIDLMTPDPDRVLIWKWLDNWAIRKGDYKLTNTNESWGKGRPSDQYLPPISNDHSLKLFNLLNDPGERINLLSRYPEKAKEMKELISIQSFKDL